MSGEWALVIALPILSAAFAWGGAYMAIRVHLLWLRSDLDDVHHDVHELSNRVGSMERHLGPLLPWTGIERRKVRP